MNMTQAPIGKFVSILYNETKNDIISNSLKEKMENLVDLIKIRTTEKGFIYASTSLQNEVFELKIELLQLLANDNGLLEKYQEVILNEIANKYYITDKKLQKLGIGVGDSLEVYFKIFSELKPIIEDNIDDIVNFNTSKLPSLEGLKALQGLQPSKELENYIVWSEASLNYDYCLIVADFVISGIIHLKVESIHELEQILRKSIIDFGAYSAFLNIWQPDFEDETTLIRNIKIKTATIEIENGKSQSFFVNDFGKLINEY
jgi:predicted Zn-dependent protease with MMP-like domain